MNNTISVVTVSYNAVETIATTIDSVLLQNYEKLEYIVIDGNSSDGTYELVCSYDKRFDDKCISYTHISEPDNGIYDAMNKAIQYCKNEWIIFLNADDYFFNENVLNDVFAEPIDEAISCVYGTSYMIKSGDVYFKKNYQMKVFSYRLPFIHQALFVRRNILLKYGFDTEYKITADADQWMHMYTDGLKFKRINTPIAYFSMEGFSHQHFPIVKKELYNLWKKYGLIKKGHVQRFIRMNIIPFLKENKFFWKIYVTIHSQ